jgi:biopolymer transport protein ExbD
MSRKHPHATGISLNVTPMIDVLFQFIIFFTLVSTYASAENIRMELPMPEKSQARNVKVVDRVVINCSRGGPASEGGEAGVLYSVGPNPAESLEIIARRVEAAHQANPKLKVIIRADKRLRYEQVRAVMEMVANEQIEDMSLVAHVAAGDSN